MEDYPLYTDLMGTFMPLRKPQCAANSAFKNSFGIILGKYFNPIESPPIRLIVVAEDTEVHNTFPIPLINRLEKHFLGMETMLEERHAATVASLRSWVQAFCHIRRQPHEMGRNFQKYVPEDVFVGKTVLLSPKTIASLGL